MKVLIFVLNDSDLLPDLLKEFNHVGINGCTIWDSNGMARELTKSSCDFSLLFGTLRTMLKPDLRNTKTLMLVLDDSKVECVVSGIEKVVGPLEEPGTGIVFTFPIDYVKGLKL